MIQLQRPENSHQRLSCWEKNIYRAILNHCYLMKHLSQSSWIIRGNSTRDQIRDHLICFWSLQRQRNLLTRAWMRTADLSFSLCPFLSSLACLALSRNWDFELWGTLNIVHLKKEQFYRISFCFSKYRTGTFLRTVTLWVWWRWQCSRLTAHITMFSGEERYK